MRIKSCLPHILFSCLPEQNRKPRTNKEEITPRPAPRKSRVYFREAALVFLSVLNGRLIYTTSCLQAPRQYRTINKYRAPPGESDPPRELVPRLLTLRRAGSADLWRRGGALRCSATLARKPMMLRARRGVRHIFGLGPNGEIYSLCWLLGTSSLGVWSIIGLFFWPDIVWYYGDWGEDFLFRNDFFCCMQTVLTL